MAYFLRECIGYIVAYIAKWTVSLKLEMLTFKVLNF